MPEKFRENGNNDLPLDSGALEAIKAIKKNQDEQRIKIMEKIEGATVEHETFSEEDIEKIIEIRKKLEEFIKESKKKNKKPNEYLSDVIEYLNSINSWMVVFSTGDVEKLQETDSLYYVMKNGASLRLKRHNLERKGLNNVVQPFMETLFFEDRENADPTEHLSIGVTPMEYCSNEFYNLQNQDKVDGKFISEIRRFYKDRKLVFVEKPKNLYHEHNGSEINNVLKVRDVEVK